MRDRPNRIADIASLVFVAGLIGLVYLLPPDTSLQEVERVGLLRVCIPDDYPPLVTGDDDAPGYEVELLQYVADRLDLRLSLHVNSAIGSDFNPRNWRVTRAQCQVIAGGVVATDMTRSFLDMTAPHLETGWVLIGDDPEASLAGRDVGFFAALTGRDRISLSRMLRNEGATVHLAQSREALITGLADGDFDVAITDALIGRQIAGENDWSVIWLSGEDERDPIAFGLWKGDLTLKRALSGALDEARAEGILDELAERYRIAPIDGLYQHPAPEEAA